MSKDRYKNYNDDEDAFDSEQFNHLYSTTAKAAQGNDNDTKKIKDNVDELFAECQRLSKAADDKNAMVNQKQKEYDNFQNDLMNKEVYLENKDDTEEIQ